MGGQRHEAGSPYGSVDPAGLGLAENQPEIAREVSPVPSYTPALRSFEFTFPVAPACPALILRRPRARAQNHPRVQAPTRPLKREAEMGTN